jgi:hypothetical protein
MFAALGFLLSPAGCATRPQHSAGAKPGASPTPRPIVRTLVGDIAIVDREKGFVLIDLGSNLYVPTPGLHLEATNAAGATTAQLEASPEQNRPFIAADIREGSPEVGDQVYR